MNKKTKKLVETAVMLAAAIILSLPFFRIEAPWMYGGSVSLGRFLPIVIIGYKYGPKWGTLTGITYSALRLLLGSLAEILGWGVSAEIVVASVVLEYIFSYGFIGLAAGISGKIFKKNMSLSLAVGAAVGLFLRFICLFVAGIIIWGYWTGGQKESFWATALYSFGYNISYMLPEIVITSIEGFLIGSIVPIRKLLQK